MTDQTTLDLERLDAALAGAPDADPEWERLVREIRAEAAPMPLSLQTRLDEAVAAGFPRRRRRVPMPAFVRAHTFLSGAVALLLVAVVGGVMLADRVTNDTSETAQIGRKLGPFQPLEGERAAPKAADSAAGAGAAAPSTAIAPSGARESLAGPRQVERSTTLGLRVGLGRISDAADGAVRATQAVGGYVSSSQVSAQGRSGSARLTLRVPSARLDDAVARLSRLGHVTTMDSSALDITSVITSAAARVRDARAERTALLRALAKASSPERISALKARVRANESELAQRKGELAAQRRRAAFATVELSISSTGRQELPPPAHDRWGPGDAAGDAVRVLEVVAGVLLVALAVLLPVALLGGAGWLGGRRVRTRRREQALGS